jgi:hypothetical protein
MSGTAAREGEPGTPAPVFSEKAVLQRLMALLCARGGGEDTLAVVTRHTIAGMLSSLLDREVTDLQETLDALYLNHVQDALVMSERASGAEALEPSTVHGVALLCRYAVSVALCDH